MSDLARPPEASRDIPFWIVRGMQPGLQISKAGHFFRHGTRDAAEAETSRLAAKFPGRRFVVLEAVAAAQVPAPEASTATTHPIAVALTVAGGAEG